MLGPGRQALARLSRASLSIQSKHSPACSPPSTLPPQLDSLPLFLPSQPNTMSSTFRGRPTGSSAADESDELRALKRTYSNQLAVSTSCLNSMCNVLVAGCTAAGLTELVERQRRGEALSAGEQNGRLRALNQASQQRLCGITAVRIAVWLD